MPQMSITCRAQHLCPYHAMAPILTFPDHVSLNGLEETGPAGPGIVFGHGLEQRRTTAGARVNALLLMIPVLSCKGPFRARQATDSELVLG